MAIVTRVPLSKGSFRWSLRLSDESLHRASVILLGVEKDVRRAAAGAVNDVAASTRTLIVRRVQKELGITQRQIRDRITVRKAKPDAKDPIAFIKVRGRRIPLVAFNAKQPRRGNGVTYRIGDKSGQIPGGFIRTITRGPYAGEKAVLKRVGRDRYPIHQKFGPSVPHVFSNDTRNAIAADALEHAATKLPSRIVARAELIMRRRLGL